MKQVPLLRKSILFSGHRQQKAIARRPDRTLKIANENLSMENEKRAREKALQDELQDII